VVAFVLFIGDLYGRGGGFLVLVPILLLWVQLYVLGLLNEAGPYARRFELVRLTVVVPLGFVALQAGGQLANMAMQGWALLFFYVSLSVLWLIRK
jgi:hypothetical protein